MAEPFHAVEWMRARREELDREYEGLSWDEVARRVSDALKDDPLWQHVRECATAPGLAGGSLPGRAPPASGVPAA